jgi:uncharacterized protein (DUF488 family)
MHTCMTVGHSNYDIATLVRILRSPAVDTIVDIRSTPYSRRYPQFNRESFRTDLELYDMRYQYLGDRLGGRHTDPQVLFPDGRVDFSKVQQLPLFQEGITRLITEIKKGQRIALLCAEKDPFDCHRFMLVAPALVKKGITVFHILGEGKLVSQEELEDRLLKKYFPGGLQPSLFESPRSRDELLEQAYLLKSRGL